MENFDLIIVGGGAAGLLAAGFALLMTLFVVLTYQDISNIIMGR